MPLIRTLIIEDNPGYAELLKDMLSSAQEGDFAVTHAMTLASGLEFLSGGDFDLALLDLRLPDAAGYTACEKVRASAPRLPIVVVSGYSPDEEFAVRCLRIGAQDYLEKGQFDQRLLLHSVRYAFQRKRIEIAYQIAQQALVETNRKLVEKIGELDRLNAILMGREERILELKDEIRALKKPPSLEGGARHEGES